MDYCLRKVTAKEGVVGMGVAKRRKTCAVADSCRSGLWRGYFSKLQLPLYPAGVRAARKTVGRVKGLSDCCKVRNHCGKIRRELREAGSGVCGGVSTGK